MWKRNNRLIYAAALAALALAIAAAWALARPSRPHGQHEPAASQVRPVTHEEFLYNHEQSVALRQYINVMFTQRNILTHPQYFGGMYINDDGLLVVMISESYARDDEAIAFLARAEDAGGAIIRYVQFPYNILRDLSQQLGRTLSSLPTNHPLALNVFSHWVDTRNNRVKVLLFDDSPQHKAQFRTDLLDSSAIELINVASDAALSHPHRPVRPRVNPLFEGVTMEVTSICQETAVVVVSIYNGADNTITTPPLFVLETYRNGEWLATPISATSFTLPGPRDYIWPGRNMTFTKRLYRGFPLQPGRYRIWKYVYSFPQDGVHDIFAEFYWE